MSVSTQTSQSERAFGSIFLIFLRLGLTSFGGPVAHLAYFRNEFVERRHWLSERSYADLVSLCQCLPGPASSQVGMALGLQQAGYRGALAAWLGFTLPSALLLILFALGITHYGDGMSAGLLQGLKAAAVAVVIQAVWAMARTHCVGLTRFAMMVLATCGVLVVPTPAGQAGVLILAAIVGLYLCKPKHLESTAKDAIPVTLRRRTGVFWLAVFFVLLFGLPLAVLLINHQALLIVDAFYRSGALVFGGGHVVLPLLQAEVVTTGWVNEDQFLAGYGAAQAVPGPLFSFAAFLGAASSLPPSGWVGGVIALFAIFTPSFLLVAGVLPFWESLRHHVRMRAALNGVNAAVVGLLLAALYDPIWTSAIRAPADFVLVFLAWVGLVLARLPAWLVVLLSGLMGWAADYFALLLVL